jgi:hypothetical protein
MLAVKLYPLQLEQPVTVWLSAWANREEKESASDTAITIRRHREMEPILLTLFLEEKDAL